MLGGFDKGKTNESLIGSETRKISGFTPFEVSLCGT